MNRQQWKKIETNLFTTFCNFDNRFLCCSCFSCRNIY